jgi:glutamate dehydrogenase/leucine dehydrogenase
VVGDGQRIDLEADTAKSLLLASGMTPKEGVVDAAISLAQQQGEISPDIEVPLTGGAKGVLTIERSDYENPENLRHLLGGFALSYLSHILAGDGIGPDSGVTPEMMQMMADAVVEAGGDNAIYNITSRPNGIPGRPPATGRAGVFVLRHLLNRCNVDLPGAQRGIVCQGLGSAGGVLVDTAHSEMAESGFWFEAVGDYQNAIFAERGGLVPGVDFRVENGRLVWWDEDKARKLSPDQLLHVPAGIKVLAATEGVVTPANHDSIADGTSVMLEVANSGVHPDSQLALERRLLLASSPLASLGGVAISLMDRHRRGIEAAYGRSLTEADTNNLLSAITRAAVELVVREDALSGAGLATSAYRVGLRRQYDESLNVAVA